MSPVHPPRNRTYLPGFNQRRPSSAPAKFTPRKNASSTANPIATRTCLHTPVTVGTVLGKPEGRDMVHDNMKDHYLKCSVEQFFSLLPHDPKWSAAAAQSVKQQLIEKELFLEPPTDADGKKLWSKSKKQVTWFGWQVWRAALLAKDQRENTRYKSAGGMFLAICKVAYGLDPQLYALQTAYFHNTPHTPTKNNVAGLNRVIPDSRSTRLPGPKPKPPRYRTRNPPPRPVVDPKTLSQKTSDCTSFAEFKKTESEASDNDMQLCVVATHVMHNDPNRRFVYAMTIKGQSVRLWRFDRAIVLVSERFDFNDAPEHLIRYALYVSYASATQAGFDPTVTPVPSIPETMITKPVASTPVVKPPVAFPANTAVPSTSATTPVNPPPNPNAASRSRRAARAKKANHKSTAKATASSSNPEGKDFIYKVNGRYFRTVGPPLSESNASNVISRGVRVWKVLECDAKGTVLAGAREGVLKDFWLYKDGKSEDWIQKDVKRRLAALDKEDPVRPTRVERMEEYFLTIIECGRVTIDGYVDATIKKPGSAKQVMLAPKKIRYATPLPDSTALRGDIRSLPGSGKGPYDNVQHAAPKQLQHHQRVHWRYVVEEKCKTMYNVSNLKVLFEAGRDIADALDLFRQAGYMHRDISGGNCMVYLDPATGKHRGKLADLEFSKEYSSLSCHDPVTGTLEFMPVEYGRKTLEFRPESSGMSMSKRRHRLRFSRYHPHPYHDLESLFWVMVWCILANFPSDSSHRPTPEQWEHWRNFISNLFCSASQTFVERLEAFKEPSILSDNLVDSGWDETFVESILDPIILLSSKIIDVYKAIQSEPQDTDSKWPMSLFRGEIYKEFADCLAAASEAVGTGDAIPMNKLEPPVEVEVGLKRGNDSPDEDARPAKRPAL